ncbi:E3 ubiquitin-protein ligase rnf181 [Phtheirospermum japonicum]|uniref:RING-type E3 ubiquitin transferase n=1 Tax=Phtheirospermum japonicum TaxID=374723 RepID=A0A830D0T9_9LAMI|nr:E3 ubiquitin-protein ligase rnf181 [Phtheirospermum japonicum]
MMGGRSGYEYSYRFWVDNEIIPLYRLCILGMMFSSGFKGFLFEIITNFRVKRARVDDDSDEIMMMMGSERFGAAVKEDEDFSCLAWKTDIRLKDYWMSDNEIEVLVREAVDFAVAQRAANPPRNPSRWLIPIVVGLDVTAVQQEGEPIDAAVDRAIKPERLMPLYLWETVIPVTLQFDEKPYRRYKSFLMELPRVRVEEEEDDGIMDACRVCLRPFTIGAQISFVPCKHACHSRCLFNWLQKGNSSCPLCGVHIPTDLELSGMSDSDSD